MTQQLRYVLDADSFIRAKREHYAFDICPGYWDSLLQGFRRKKVVSIDPIRRELLRGNDALSDWVKDRVPPPFFESVDSEDVQEMYRRVVQWVEDSTQYSTAAKHRFASGADPWLVAFAKAKNFTPVTYEVSGLESKSKIKLPDVARQFDVKCIPPYVMLRQLRVKLKLDRPAGKR